MSLTTLSSIVFLLLIVIQVHLAFRFQNRAYRSYGFTKRALHSIAETINVDLGDRSYPIYINEHILADLDYIQPHLKSKKVLIVSNDKIAPLFLDDLRNVLENNGIVVHDIVLPDGEQHKSLSSAMIIIDKALDAKLDRKTSFIALGGGVIGDLTGFAASIYQRGVNFIQVPTSIMAMVDSAVGGKTAVNHPRGKNIIGSFYQPSAVVIDLRTLQTLPDREFKSGLSEVIKYGLIYDQPFFEWLEKNMPLVLQRNKEALMYIIKRSCEIKSTIVTADEKEAGIRALLNLGHTFGHAIEVGFGYGIWLHGEAVAAGIIMAAELSYKLNYVPKQLLNRIKNLIELCELPVNFNNKWAIEEIGELKYKELYKNLSVDSFLDFMSLDKKVNNGQQYLILLRGLGGDAFMTCDYNKQLLKNVISDFCTK